MCVPRRLWPLGLLLLLPAAACTPEGESSESPSITGTQGEPTETPAGSTPTPTGLSTPTESEATLPPGGGALFLNEAMADNDAAHPDEDEEYSDWLEIYNASDQAIDLSGYTLSDDPEEPEKWTFPARLIDAGGFLVVWASDKDRVEGEGELHTNFKLSAGGEPVLLSDPEGALVDRVELPEMGVDLGYGRLEDGGSAFAFFSVASPGASNAEGSPAQE